MVRRNVQKFMADTALIEERQVNMIDAERLYAIAIDKINELQGREDFLTNKSLQKQVKQIKSAMWEIWDSKEIEEAIAANMPETIQPRLSVAKEDMSRTLHVEVTGEGGGPMEIMRRISKEELDAYRETWKSIDEGKKRELIAKKTGQRP